MTKAVQIEKTGAPEVMQLVTVKLAKPAPGEVRIRQTAVGLNYIDTYLQRIEDVTAADIATVCGTLLKEDNRTVCHMLSDGSDAAAEPEDDLETA